MLLSSLSFILADVTGEANTQVKWGLETERREDKFVPFSRLDTTSANEKLHHLTKCMNVAVSCLATSESRIWEICLIFEDIFETNSPYSGQFSLSRETLVSLSLLEIS